MAMATMTMIIKFKPLALRQAGAMITDNDDGKGGNGNNDGDD